MAGRTWSMDAMVLAVGLAWGLGLVAGVGGTWLHRAYFEAIDADLNVPPPRPASAPSPDPHRRWVKIEPDDPRDSTISLADMQDDTGRRSGRLEGVLHRCADGEWRPDGLWIATAVEGERRGATSGWVYADGEARGLRWWRAADGRIEVLEWVADGGLQFTMIFTKSGALETMRITAPNRQQFELRDLQQVAPPVAPVTTDGQDGPP